MNNIKYADSILINLIISSIIPFLIWGPFFPDLIVSISTLFFLYYVFKNKDFYYLSNKPFLIFFSFCIYCIFLSIFVAQDMLLSFESSLFYFRIGVFSCFIWYLVDNDRSILTYFYYSLTVCFFALVIDGYYQYFTGENILGYKIIGIRVSSFFGDELILGSYLARLFPLLFALFLVKKKKRFEIYFIALLFILVDVLIYMSAERSSFFFLNISTIFIIILIKDYQKFRLVTFVLAIVCVFILSLNSPTLSNRMFKSPAEIMGFIEKSSKTNENTNNYSEIDKVKKPKAITIFSPTHDALIRTAYNMFKSEPVLGHGPKMFRLMCKNKDYAVGKHYCGTHPHNFYVQLLAETGVIGFLFLLSVLGYILYAGLRQFKFIILKQKRPYTDYQVCLLAGILITVWPLSTNGNFFNNWLMIIYCLPAGFYLQSIYSKNN